MVECNATAVMVNPDLVCQTGKDKPCVPCDCSKSNQESVLNRFERVLRSISAYAEAYTHRDDPVLLSGGGRMLIRSEPDR
jgi:hypothetical protein